MHSRGTNFHNDNNNKKVKDVTIKKATESYICLSNDYFKWPYPVESSFWGRCTSVMGRAPPAGVPR